MWYNKKSSLKQEGRKKTRKQELQQINVTRGTRTRSRTNIAEERYELSGTRQPLDPKKQENVYKTLKKTINDVRESDLSIEERKMTFILENFETDKMEIVNQDGKLTEEAIKLFKFSR